MFYTDLENEPKYGTEDWKQWNLLRRKEIENQVGQVWDTSELTNDFIIDGFLAPCCYGRRRSDNAKIILLFTHSPRFYYGLTVG